MADPNRIPSPGHYQGHPRHGSRDPHPHRHSGTLVPCQRRETRGPNRDGREQQAGVTGERPVHTEDEEGLVDHVSQQAHPHDGQARPDRREQGTLSGAQQGGEQERRQR